MSPSRKDKPLSLIQRCYRLILLRARERAGVSLDLLELDELYRLDRELRSADDDDPDAPERRAFRRAATALPGTVCVGSARIPITVLDLSGDGANVDTGEALEIGARVTLRLGRSGATATRYVFPCEVVRDAGQGERYGLRFCGTPLEVRYQSYASREVRTSWLLRAAAHGVGNG